MLDFINLLYPFGCYIYSRKVAQLLLDMTVNAAKLYSSPVKHSRVKPEPIDNDEEPTLWQLSSPDTPAASEGYRDHSSLHRSYVKQDEVGRRVPVQARGKDFAHFKPVIGVMSRSSQPSCWPICQPLFDETCLLSSIGAPGTPDASNWPICQ
jgi:hypothetical protein